MAFTVKDFPGRVFKSIGEFEEAQALRNKVEQSLEERSSDKPLKIVAHVVPAEPGTLERRLSALEKKVEKIFHKLFRRGTDNSPGKNQEGIQIGMVLKGESKGESYSLKVLPNNYECSDGKIYASLSGAALGVSGNRRSGWRFWQGPDGRSIGEVVGRFDPDADSITREIV